MIGDPLFRRYFRARAGRMILGMLRTFAITFTCMTIVNIVGAAIYNEPLLPRFWPGVAMLLALSAAMMIAIVVAAWFAWRRSWIRNGLDDPRSRHIVEEMMREGDPK